MTKSISEDCNVAQDSGLTRSIMDDSTIDSVNTYNYMTSDGVTTGTIDCFGGGTTTGPIIFTANTNPTFTSPAFTGSISNIGIGTSSPFTISNMSVTGNVFTDDPNNYREWEHRFPDYKRVQAMCKKYPALNIAFDHFKMIYELSKDDFDNIPYKK